MLWTDNLIFWFRLSCFWQSSPGHEAFEEGTYATCLVIFEYLIIQTLKASTFEKWPLKRLLSHSLGPATSTTWWTLARRPAMISKVLTRIRDVLVVQLFVVFWNLGRHEFSFLPLQRPNTRQVPQALELIPASLSKNWACHRLMLGFWSCICVPSGGPTPFSLPYLLQSYQTVSHDLQFST